MEVVKELPKRYWEISAFNKSLYAEDLITALVCAARIEIHEAKPEVWQCERESKTIIGKSRVDLTQRAYRELVEVFKNLNEIANEEKAWKELGGLLTSSIVENINIEPPKEETPKKDFVHPYICKLTERVENQLLTTPKYFQDKLATIWTAEEFIEEESVWHDGDISSLFYEHPAVGDLARRIIAKRHKISPAEFGFDEELEDMFDVAFEKIAIANDSGDPEVPTYLIYKCVASALYDKLTDKGLKEAVEKIATNFVEIICRALTLKQYGEIVPEDFEEGDEYEISVTEKEFLQKAEELVLESLGNADYGFQNDFFQ